MHDRQEDDFGSLPLPKSFFFETGSLTEPEARPFKLGQLTNKLQVSMCPTSNNEVTGVLCIPI